MSARTVTLRLEHAHEVKHHGRRSYQAKIVRLPRHVVLVDGERIGAVERRMATRETRSQGRRYVNDRWESPAWFTDPSFGLHYDTRARAVAAILEDAGHDWLIARDMAKAATVEKP